VNFIMKKDFEGMQIDGQYSLYQHNNDFSGPGAVQLRDTIQQRHSTNPSQFNLPDDNVTDGNGVQGTITVGVNTEDGRGNLTAYVSYQDSKSSVGARPRLLGVRPGCEPDDLVRLWRLRHGIPGHVHGLQRQHNSAAGPDGKRGTADDFPDTNPLPSFNSTVDQTSGNFRPFDNPRISTTSVRRTSICVRTHATAWVRWATTSSHRSLTCTRS
jgi:hypothetical protein